MTPDEQQKALEDAINLLNRIWYEVYKMTSTSSCESKFLMHAIDYLSKQRGQQFCDVFKEPPKPSLWSRALEWLQLRGK
jgi:hypothetical protein